MNKILWIVNSALGPLGEKIYGRREQGAWMDALLNDFRNHKEYILLVATTAAVDKTISIEENEVVYYALPSTPPNIYDENKKVNIESWKELIDRERPELIQIWGTEFTHGLCALRSSPQVPAVIYMQGYLGSIARYYFAGLSFEDIITNITFRDVIKRDSIFQQQKKYEKSKFKEKELLELAGNIISENKWCETNIKAIVPRIKNYVCPLSINRIFSEYKWDIEKAEIHSVVCTASGYPLKGLHMVLRAIALLKDAYPDIKLYVPGTKMVSEPNIEWQLRKRGYTKYIERLIKKLNIADNIIWTGELSQEELAQLYKKARVFVLSSSIENHSSSLKEAMMVGVPSIASEVGGIPEYINNMEDAILYRFEEYDIMAFYIRQVFEDNELAKKLSENGRKKMIELHNDAQIYGTIAQIYDDILKNR